MHVLTSEQLRKIEIEGCLQTDFSCQVELRKPERCQIRRPKDPCQTCSGCPHLRATVNALSNPYIIPETRIGLGSTTVEFAWENSSVLASVLPGIPTEERLKIIVLDIDSGANRISLISSIIGNAAEKIIQLISFQK